MAHTHKPDFVFRRNEPVHLIRRGRQFSRLLAAEVCASAVVMLDTPCSEVVWLPTPFASFPFISPPVRHRMPSHFNWSLPTNITGLCTKFSRPVYLAPGIFAPSVVVGYRHQRFQRFSRTMKNKMKRERKKTGLRGQC
jgi:hypothetical protein